MVVVNVMLVKFEAYCLGAGDESSQFPPKLFLIKEKKKELSFQIETL